MSATSFPFPIFVCDTGGTNVRFALKAAPDAPLGAAVHLKTHDYRALSEAIEAAAAKLSARPRSVIACGAGPEVNDTTLKWLGVYRLMRFRRNVSDACCPVPRTARATGPA